MDPTNLAVKLVDGTVVTDNVIDHFTKPCIRDLCLYTLACGIERKTVTKHYSGKSNLFICDYGDNRIASVIKAGFKKQRSIDDNALCPVFPIKKDKTLGFGNHIFVGDRIQA